MNSDLIYAFYDTECTGLKKIQSQNLNTPTSIRYRGSEVIQIGGILTDSSMIPFKLFCHYCDAVVAESTQEASSVHNISLRDIRRYIPGQYLSEVMLEYIPELFSKNISFVGYNAEYDMSMVAQTLSNSPLSWNWEELNSNLLPRRGRHSIDIMKYLPNSGHRRRLSSYDKELKLEREEFINKYRGVLKVDTNCMELLSNTWNKAHNAFFDALNTYLLWGDRVWKKKLV